MSRQPTKKSELQLEDSQLWQLASSIERQTREAVKTVPYAEYYRLADGSMSIATYLVNNAARTVGRGNSATAFDWRLVRGDLFALKGLLGIVQELGYASSVQKLMADIDKLQKLLEKEVTVLEEAKKADEQKE